MRTPSFGVRIGHGCASWKHLVVAGEHHQAYGDSRHLTVADHLVSEGMAVGWLVTTTPRHTMTGLALDRILTQSPCRDVAPCRTGFSGPAHRPVSADGVN